MHETKKEVCNKFVKIPEGSFHSGNCNGCIYFYPQGRDENGRSYCEYYDTYYYPHERNGCLSRKS